MTMHGRLIVAFAAWLCLGPATSVWASAGMSVGPMETPMESLSRTAKAFYRQALERPTRGLPRGPQLDELKYLLSTDLLERIRKSAAAEDRVADVVIGGSTYGRFSGNPLLGNYEGAHDVRFDSVEIKGDGARVTATLYYSNRSKPMFTTDRFRIWTDVLEFKREYSSWVVSDICFHGDCADRFTKRLAELEAMADGVLPKN